MALQVAASCGKLDSVDEMLDGMTPQEFDELVAWNEIEPIGATPFHRLFVFMAACMSNQFKDEKTEPITMEDIAKFCGIPAEQFEQKEEVMTGQAFAASMQQGRR